MKTLLFVLSLITTLSGNAQEVTSNSQFILTGIVNNRDTGFIVLNYYNDILGKLIRDTAWLKNGKFKFEGETSTPTRASLKGKKKMIDFEVANQVYIFLEPGTLHIELTENDYRHAKMTGSFTQKEYDLFHRQIDSIDLKYNSILNQLTDAKYAYQNAKTNTEKEIALQMQSELAEKLSPRGNEIIHDDISFVLSHPDSYVSPFVLFIPANELPVDSAMVIFNVLTPRIKNSMSGKYLGNLLRKRKQNSISKIAHDFKTKEANGKIFSLTQLKGKFVLIDFWASWCVPCLAEIPDIKKLYYRYKSRGFDIVAISLDKDTLSWTKAIQKENIAQWHNVLANDEIAKYYPNVTNPIPSGILIDPQGKIIWKSTEEKRIGEALYEVMK